MTPRQQFVISCIIFSIIYELICEAELDLKRMAKRVFYVTVACYIVFDASMDN